MSMFSHPDRDARLEGMPIFSAAPGTTSHYHTFAYDCEWNGIEFYSSVVGVGDNVSVYVEYFNGFFWAILNKFSKNWNIFAGEKTRIVLFPTSPVKDLRIRFDYFNHTQTNVDVAVNLFKFVKNKTVDPLVGETGEDW